MADHNRASARAIEVEIDTCLRALARHAPGGTVDRVTPTARRLAEFLRHCRVDRLGDVTAELAEQFVRSRLKSGLPAGLPTMHDRRATVRLLFRAARRIGLASGDPTLDLRLPCRSSLTARPLTDGEIELAHDVALWSLSSRRIPAVWALAEATARGAELANIRPIDLDLDSGRVWLHGGKRTCERWGELSGWGVRVLRGRLTEIDAHGFIVYAGEGRESAGQVSTCSAISTVLVRAGLAGEPDVRPASVAAWAARRRFDAGASIADVARVLGVRSLDLAAQVIGWDWNQ